MDGAPDGSNPYSCIQYLKDNFEYIRTCSHRIQQASFRQIQPTASSKKPEMHQYFCVSCSLLKYVRKSAYAAYRNKF